MPRVPQDLLRDIGVARAASEVQSRLNKPGFCVVNGNGIGCWEAQAGIGGEGYCSIRMLTNNALRVRNGQAVGNQNETLTINLHRLALFARLGRNIQPHLESSHLCHNAACFNGPHVIEEAGDTNRQRSREHCLGDIVCTGGTLLRNANCVFTPACIRPNLILPCCGHEEERDGSTIGAEDEDLPGGMEDVIASDPPDQDAEGASSHHEPSSPSGRSSGHRDDQAIVIGSSSSGSLPLRRVGVGRQSRRLPEGGNSDGGSPQENWISSDLYELQGSDELRLAEELGVETQNIIDGSDSDESSPHGTSSFIVDTDEIPESDY